MAAKTHVTRGSSSIRGYQYDPKTEEMIVTFRNGGIYRYMGVPKASYKAMQRNKSAGKTLHKWVKKPGLDYEKIAKTLEHEYVEEWEDLFPGGAADNKAPLDFDLSDLDRGMKIELRAAKNRQEAMELAMDHLVEDPEYYDKTAAPLSQEFITRAIRKALKDDPSGRRVARFINRASARGGHRLELGKELGLKEARRHLAGHPSISGPRVGNVLAPVSGEFIAKAASGAVTPQENLVKNVYRYLIGDSDSGRSQRAKLRRTRLLKSKVPDKLISKMIAKSTKAHKRGFKKSASPVKCQKTFDGLKLKLEQEPGDVRSGKSKEGKTWSRKMSASYGYVAGSGGMGADGEALDIYMAKDPTPGSKVYRVSQKKKSGEFDEHKYMLGYDSAAAAKRDFLKHMPSWAFGSMNTVDRSELETGAKLASAAKGNGMRIDSFMQGLADEMMKTALSDRLIKKVVSKYKNDPYRMELSKRRLDAARRRVSSDGSISTTKSQALVRSEIDNAQKRRFNRDESRRKFHGLRPGSQEVSVIPRNEQLAIKKSRYSGERGADAEAGRRLLDRENEILSSKTNSDLRDLSVGVQAARKKGAIPPRDESLTDKARFALAKTKKANRDLLRRSDQSPQAATARIRANFSEKMNKVINSKNFRGMNISDLDEDLLSGDLAKYNLNREKLLDRLAKKAPKIKPDPDDMRAISGPRVGNVLAPVSGEFIAKSASAKRNGMRIDSFMQGFVDEMIKIGAKESSPDKRVNDAVRGMWSPVNGLNERVSSATKDVVNVVRKTPMQVADRMVKTRATAAEKKKKDLAANRDSKTTKKKEVSRLDRSTVKQQAGVSRNNESRPMSVTWTTKTKPRYSNAEIAGILGATVVGGSVVDRIIGGPNAPRPSKSKNRLARVARKAIFKR